MSNNKQKLELTWIGKNNPEYDIANIEPRILLENTDLSNCQNDPDTENMIIHGDNLLALKALLPEYEGKVKCIYIDPPYNTGSAFEHYDDSVEHSTWLSLMKPRLELFRLLLREDGFIMVQIDNNEMMYLKVLMDEVFGRPCFINDIIWKRRGGSANPNNRLNNVTDYILWYSKKPEVLLQQIYSLDDDNTQDYINERFTNEIDGKKYMLAPIERNAKLGLRETLRYEYKGYVPQWGWMMSKENLEKMDQSHRLHWNSKGRPNRRVFLDEYQGQPIGNLWTDIKVINPMAVERQNFDGQKPEKLLERFLTLTSAPGDVVLDSFLGSGTTAAVAQKMGRKYIGIEMGEHAYTHCKVRLDKVIDGTDQGGISKTVEWKGGGAYKFYELAPSFIVKDEFGNSIIDTFYNDSKLIKAMCKLMNFTYKPSQTEYWKHGVGQGKNYLYVTTQLLTSGMVQQIAAHLVAGESLIICPKKFEPGADKLDSRIIIKKIPQSVLKACHFGKKEYLLPIKEKAMEEVETEEDNEE